MCRKSAISRDKGNHKQIFTSKEARKEKKKE